MKIQTLASGSSGNCTFIDSGSAKILVDAGISARQVSERLKSVGAQVGELNGVIISHEHQDHTKAITVLPVPVYVSSRTRHLWSGVRDLREFRTDEPFGVGDILITPFPVPHDAVDPVGFTVEAGGKKVGIVTDIGSETGLVLERLSDCDMLIIESNHDEGRLLTGRYPLEVKQRVAGRLGHLSNRQCSRLLESVAHGNLRFVVLAHLSERNNLPRLALDAARRAISGFSASLHIAPKSCGEVFVL
ncbi:MBL fold metallo-hydrolase [Candidatus Mycalebacterium sp.]